MRRLVAWLDDLAPGTVWLIAFGFFFLLALFIALGIVLLSNHGGRLVHSIWIFFLMLSGGGAITFGSAGLNSTTRQSTLILLQAIVWPVGAIVMALYAFFELHAPR